MDGTFFKETFNENELIIKNGFLSIMGTIAVIQKDILTGEKNFT